MRLAICAAVHGTDRESCVPSLLGTVRERRLDAGPDDALLEIGGQAAHLFRLTYRQRELLQEGVGTNQRRSAILDGGLLAS